MATLCSGVASRAPNSRARSTISGAKTVRSASVSDFFVIRVNRCEVPIRSFFTCRAQTGWSADTHSTSVGTPARAPAAVVPAPP